MMITEANEILELCFEAEKDYKNPFFEVDLDLIAEGKRGKRVFPCFWAGGNIWKARISFDETGEYFCKTVCNNGDKGLSGHEFQLKILPYTGTDKLKKHGRLRVSEDRTHLEFKDGTPFFWLGDTWWMSLSKRLEYPDEFYTLALDRVKKGFSLVHIVAGIYPDMEEFDPRGENESGHPWTEDNSTIRPEYFDFADRRIKDILNLGLVPLIVACWGYYAEILGFERLQKYWRYLIARYGAGNVLWCLCGEAAMPWYHYHQDPKKFAEKQAEQKIFWSNMARYVRSIEPYGTPITLHPSFSSRECIDDERLLDFEMLQSGHSDGFAYNCSLEYIEKSKKAEISMPVIQSEVCYEGICEGSRQEVQRQLFWTNMLSGAAGYTYGANGIWQINSPKWEYGSSPHGAAWGIDYWQDAMNYKGSSELALGKKILEKYPWYAFKSHPEWITPHRETTETCTGFAAGTDSVRMFYITRFCPTPTFHNLDNNWKGKLIDPSFGREIPLDDIIPDFKGDWLFTCKGLHVIPVMRDWVIVFERKN